MPPAIRCLPFSCDASAERNGTKVNQNAQTLGQARVPRLLAQLAIPAVVAQIINLLYNIVDRIYIGHIPEIGADALTGAGLFMPILMLINAFALLLGSGGAPRAAIFMGKRDNQTAEKIMGNCFALLMALSVVLTVVFYIFAPQLLELFGASKVTKPYAVEYARIYILGTVFVQTVMGMNPFITTQGFAKISMLTTVIGAAINIVLDPIFIFLLDLGVKGAALATVLSQAVGAAWVLCFLFSKKTILRLKVKYFRPNAGIILPCLALGVSGFVMMATESILSICFTSSLSDYGGDIAVGAMTIVTSVCQLVVMPLQGICQGGQPIISYNYGAHNPGRVKEAFKCQFFACICFSGLCWAAILLLPRVFSGMFTDDAALADYAARALRIYMAGIFSLGFQISCQQSFVALGQAKISLFLACLRKLILLIPLIYVLPNFINNHVFAVFLAEPISDILAATVTTVVFFARFQKILKHDLAAKR
ncbi:MAG: MATE family efflux transporter [Oscillospiraceae bacterium]|nr:MATE family efflux transporter [Oscillospiraceae bacterium]